LGTLYPGKWLSSPGLASSTNRCHSVKDHAAALGSGGAFMDSSPFILVSRYSPCIQYSLLSLSRTIPQLLGLRACSWIERVHGLDTSTDWASFILVSSYILPVSSTNRYHSVKDHTAALGSRVAFVDRPPLLCGVCYLSVATCSRGSGGIYAVYATY
jgi:hypothetical protein